MREIASTLPNKKKKNLPAFYFVLVFAILRFFAWYLVSDLRATARTIATPKRAVQRSAMRNLDKSSKWVKKLSSMFQYNRVISKFVGRNEKSDIKDNCSN